MNQRIEDKNYGRAGRKGQRGSYTLIMQYNDEYGPLSDDNLKLKIIKEKGKKPNMKGLKINQKWNDIHSTKRTIISNIL